VRLLIAVELIFSWAHIHSGYLTLAVLLKGLAKLLILGGGWDVWQDHMTFSSVLVLHLPAYLFEDAYILGTPWTHHNTVCV
jgi:hypothetical protein